MGLRGRSLYSHLLAQATPGARQTTDVLGCPPHKVWSAGQGVRRSAKGRGVVRGRRPRPGRALSPGPTKGLWVNLTGWPCQAWGSAAWVQAEGRAPCELGVSRHPGRPRRPGSGVWRLGWTTCSHHPRHVLPTLTGSPQGPGLGACWPPPGQALSFCFALSYPPGVPLAPGSLGSTVGPPGQVPSSDGDGASKWHLLSSVPEPVRPRTASPRFMQRVAASASSTPDPRPSGGAPSPPGPTEGKQPVLSRHPGRTAPAVPQLQPLALLLPGALPPAARLSGG